MSRIANAFKNQAKIAYLTAGDGGELCIDYFLALIKGGANILEIGMPFSDPVADGVVIQQAMERSLADGTNLTKVLEIIAQIRSHDDQVGLVLFTYCNPIWQNLPANLERVKAAGADAILLVDLPYEESAEVRFHCKNIGLELIMIASLSTSLSRIEMLSQHGQGFLYYACRKGTTGARSELDDATIIEISKVKQHASLPVAVGFGVSNNQMVNNILQVADGCVIGSYFVDKVANGLPPYELVEIAREVFYGN